MKAKPVQIYRNLTIGKTARFDAKLVHLLRCAAQAFAQHGYERTSIRHVAREAGLSLAGLYYYVSSKEELLFLIQFHTFRSLVEGLEQILRSRVSAGVHLRRMVEAHVRYLVDHLAELKVCTRELDSLGGEFYERVRELRQRYFELTRGIVRRLCPSRLDANLATLYLFGMLNWIVMWFDPQRNDPGELADTLLRLFLKGYTGCRQGGGGR